MLTRLRSNANRIIIRVARICLRLNISPSLITLSGLILSIFAIPCAIFKNYILLFLVIVLTSFMDIVDGATARLGGKTTAFGGILDSVCDRIEEFSFLISLYFTGMSAPLVLIAITISYTISYLRALGEIRGIKMEGIGLLERGERLILIAGTVLLLLLFNGKPVTNFGILIYEIPIVLMIFLGIVTIVQRILYLYRWTLKIKNNDR
ncbi:MAG: CDP-alcohol phosphatidyltransferase family protein [Ignisphaera sp.]